MDDMASEDGHPSKDERFRSFYGRYLVRHTQYSR